MRLFVQGAVLLLGMGFLSAPAKAQKVVIEDDAPNSIVLVSQDKAGDEIVRIMNETQSPRFHDPKAPRFVLTDRKGRFALGIGGYVKATAEYDFGGISDDVDFYPSMIPNGGQNYVRNQFQMDATTSTIFLKLVGRTKHLGDFVVYTAGNFREAARSSSSRTPMCLSLVSRWVTIIVPSWIWPLFRPRSIMRGLPDRFSAVPPCYAMSVLSVRDGKRV